MSLIKCDECEHHFSDKAKFCPRCGAPLPKRRSKAGILFVVLLLIVWLVMPLAPSKKNNQVVISGETQLPKQNIITKPETATEVSKIYSKWQTDLNINAMTGERTHLTSSPFIEPIKKMTFPYEDITAKLVVSCNKRENNVYIEFSDSPNLANGDVGRGYVSIETKIKWDSNIENVELLQFSGQRRLIFNVKEKNDIIKRLNISRKVMIELRWHRQDPVYFDFNLDGASDAIKQIQHQCWKET